MSNKPIPFADNWAYLKTELSWLDRLLMLAVARQRQETKDTQRLAKTPADRVSSHWWKGVISFQQPAYDDCRPPQSAAPKGSYQQQLEARVKVSQQKGVALALPALRQHLGLTLFEKNLILLTLAPEINRRYGRLYQYLHTGNDQGVAELPTLDLALRLLCRNDLERRRSRAQLAVAESLLQGRVLSYVAPAASTRLSSYLRLSDDWVDYLLAEQPDPALPALRLSGSVLALPPGVTRYIHPTTAAVGWPQLVLPPELKVQLQGLSRPPRKADCPAQPTAGIALFVGPSGTGKTLAAIAIATAQQQPLYQVDLSSVPESDWLSLLTALQPERYPVLLIKAPSVWFGRSSALDSARLLDWLQQRRSARFTGLSTPYLHLVRARWRQLMDTVLDFPLPDRDARQQLWQQALAAAADLDAGESLDWASLAKSFKLSGGEIQAIAASAIALMQTEAAPTVTAAHLRLALIQHGKPVSQLPLSIQR
ncbi:AAA family ATPase [Romeria aff. gracilis LEGE 07310]|uniref:AAA family ATPase n=1 Tax=Vasconcelosia minhoensis LEGE 07310 TaxID=915328 RepID=A0A8J7A725_9CYAN|nr:AAA family ATPase [Romeria gracilis]MBE9078062.1 AAA family ATPase [Romeria aff. gracilis LEGE 07310]